MSQLTFNRELLSRRLASGELVTFWAEVRPLIETLPEDMQLWDPVLRELVGQALKIDYQRQLTLNTKKK